MNAKENVDEEITSRESNDCERESSLEEITKLIISGEVEASGFGLDSEQKDEVIRGAVKKIKSLRNRVRLLVVGVLVTVLVSGSTIYYVIQKVRNQFEDVIRPANLQNVWESASEVFGKILQGKKQTKPEEVERVAEECAESSKEARENLKELKKELKNGTNEINKTKDQMDGRLNELEERIQ